MTGYCLCLSFVFKLIFLPTLWKNLLVHDFRDVTYFTFFLYCPHKPPYDQKFHRYCRNAVKCFIPRPSSYSRSEFNLKGLPGVQHKPDHRHYNTKQRKQNFISFLNFYEEYHDFGRILSFDFLVALFLLIYPSAVFHPQPKLLATEELNNANFVIIDLKLLGDKERQTFASLQPKLMNLHLMFTLLFQPKISHSRPYLYMV